MLNSRPFYDLCIQDSYFNKDNFQKNLKALYNYGYKTIAINQSIDDSDVEPKKKKKKGEPREPQDAVPVPFDLTKIEELVNKLEFGGFTILNRLTVSFASLDTLYKITKSPNFKKYHIVAAAPTTPQALTHTCSTFEADIFTFNPENKFNLRLNRKLYNQLIDRGYHFELQYAPAILDSTKRKNLIHAANLFHLFGKSKNIIISSGADNVNYLRGPYDIINLGLIFGLSELQCKTAITHCAKKTVINSVGRRHGKAVMFVENVEKSPEETKRDSYMEMIEDSDDDITVVDQPKSKKTKT
ncbi:unnamed protein product [Acanthoscelides obtectus]|uniref:Uncharacterized protein n=1 Tax=Acanthoscelides obtectus TaxID=200917 RepID=A0A9P0LMS7_ACAOB|nr:unnamed protein product [Acanthoscelides obtectus]CAK1641476.1 Ribonuclease P protein subunit p30 [Acanthoscelides obtectus]